ncbi:retrotransposon protein [Hordeum vulgare]|nr:retrotransposon protein [Hordeum vulgare]
MALIPYSGGSGTTMSMSVPMLTGENYTTWPIKVEADLDAAGLWEAVVPPEEAASAVIVKKDKPARAYLLRALSDDLLLHVAAKKTAAEIWSSLKSRFVKADRAVYVKNGLSCSSMARFMAVVVKPPDTIDELVGLAAVDKKAIQKYIISATGPRQ